MKEWLKIATQYSIMLIDAMALVVIVVGTVEAFFRGFRVLLSSPTGHESGTSGCAMRAGWWPASPSSSRPTSSRLRSRRAGTTVGRVAAIAVIRTFLNYFLERDLAEVRERQREATAARGRIDAA